MDDLEVVNSTRCPECNTNNYLILPGYNVKVHVCGKVKKELEKCSDPACKWCQTCLKLRIEQFDNYFKV